MSGKVVNLTRARKSRARDEKRQVADANAAKHGRTKAEREAERRAAETASRHLDQHRRDRDWDGDGDGDGDGDDTP